MILKVSNPIFNSFNCENFDSTISYFAIKCAIPSVSLEEDNNKFDAYKN